MARDRASRPEAKALRLFVAIDVPAEAKAELDATIEPHRASVPGARWTRPEGWHVTVKFLGGTWPRLVGDVESAVEAAAGAARSFRSTLTTVGAFPSPSRPRVLWAGIADPGGGLAGVAKDLDDRLAAHFEQEKRGLTPH